MLYFINKLKQEGKRIGFTCSTFDLLHTGHIAMLAECKSQCDFLIVGLLSDPTISRPETKNKPIQTMFERWVQLQAVSYIDLIIPFDTEQNIIDIINIIEPDVRFVGEEYKGTNHTGYNISNIIYNKRKHRFSSTELRNRLKINHSGELNPKHKLTLEQVNYIRNSNKTNKELACLFSVGKPCISKIKTNKTWTQ